MQSQYLLVATFVEIQWNIELKEFGDIYLTQFLVKLFKAARSYGLFNTSIEN